VDADRLNNAAANALLKTLEDHPGQYTDSGNRQTLPASHNDSFTMSTDPLQSPSSGNSDHSAP
jgi:hypothetical protein